MTHFWMYGAAFAAVGAAAFFAAAFFASVFAAAAVATEPFGFGVLSPESPLSLLLASLLVSLEGLVKAGELLAVL